MADLLYGKVSDNVDPEGLGRVSVALLDHGEEVILPWIRVLQPMASSGTGAVWLPEIDDNVVVLTGRGGVESMLVLGSVYSGSRLPPGEAKVEHKHLLTPGGNEVLLDDTADAEQIIVRTKDATIEILLDNATPEITITAGDNFTINANTAVKINTTDATVEASGDVVVNGDSVTIDGGSVEIKSTGTVSISGSTVELG